MKEIDLKQDLFSAVMMLKTSYPKEIEYFKINPNNEITYFEETYKQWKEINVYEFIEKCKDWALEKGFSIETTHSFTKICSIIDVDTGRRKETFKANDNIDLILKACNFILNNITKED